MPAPAAHGALYKRFAQLSAAQKASARAMYHASREREVQSFGYLLTEEPLVNCYFLPMREGVSTFGFYTEDPATAGGASFTR